MSEKKHQPTMAWHPETGESQIFNHPDDVPTSWLDTHPDNVKAKAPAPAPKPTKPVAEVLPMTRDAIVAALTAGQIAFKPEASDAKLYKLLDKSVREHLLANKVEIPEGADVPALLALANSKSE